MNHYDYYNDLLPEQFEDFAIDIGERIANTTFEVFSRVKDRGVDARGEKRGKVIILQAKRYANYEELRKVLRTELEKVKRLQPNRYMLITSSKLSIANKDEILKNFQGYIQKKTDIIGKEDLDHLISRVDYRDILEKYTELWLKNTHVVEDILTKILNRSINEESKFQLNKMLQKEKGYAENQYFYNALEILKKEHFLLIYGDAGVGKSSLAGHLCCYFLKEMQNAEFIYTDSLENLRREYQENKEQVIFLDDFWGSWRKDKNGNSANTRQLKQTIEMIKQDESKILIITSREYIFRQFEEENYGDKRIFENASIVMRMDEYTDFQKAKILFKQIENTSWNWNDIYQITEHYQDFIENENYNPRIIEMAVDRLEKTKEVKYEEIYEELLEAIYEPEEFLSTIFYGQKEGAQIICILLLLFSGEIKLETLRMMFCDYIDEEGKTEEAKKEHFKDYIKQLENTMIETYRRDEDDDIIVIFKNATIEESVQKYLVENIYAYSRNIIKITKYLNPLLALCNVWNDDKNYDIYREKLELEKELQKQIVRKITSEYEELELYQVEELYEDPVDNIEEQGIEKLISIIKLNRELGNEELNSWIMNKVQTLWESLEENNINYYEKGYFSELLKELKKSNLSLVITPREILKRFYQKINFASEYITFYEIGKLYPKEYEELMKMYGMDIQEKIEQQLEKDEQYFKEHECDMEYQYLTMETRNELQKIYYEDSYLEGDAREEDKKEIERTYHHKENGNIQKEIEKLLGLEFKWLEEKEKIDYISNMEASSEDKEMLMDSINKWYISPFFQSRESIDGIVEFLITKKKFLVRDFIFELLAYRLNKGKLKTSLIGLLAVIAYDGIRSGSLLFKREWILSYGIRERELEKLIRTKIFYKSGNWLRFDNLEVLVFLASIVINFNGDDLTEAICGLQYICKRSGYFIEHTIFQICEEINESAFYEEIIEPNLRYFIGQINKRSQLTIAKSIIQQLYMEISKEENTQIISTIGLADDIPMLGLENLVAVYIADDIMEKLTKINLEQFGSYMEKENRVKLYKHLEDKKFITILKETGVVELLNKMYEKITNRISGGT